MFFKSAELITWAVSGFSRGLAMSQGQGSDLGEIAEQRFKDGKECAKKATYYDEAKQFGGALSFYDEAVEAFHQACQLDQKYVHILSQVEAYARRAAEIRYAFSNNNTGNGISNLI